MQEYALSLSPNRTAFRTARCQGSDCTEFCGELDDSELIFVRSRPTAYILQPMLHSQGLGAVQHRGLAAPKCGLRCFESHRTDLRASAPHQRSLRTASRKPLVCRAAVEAPAKEPTKKSKVASAPAEFTPEEAADVYKDMKLGRDFEEM